MTVNPSMQSSGESGIPAADPAPLMGRAMGNQHAPGAAPEPKAREHFLLVWAGNPITGAQVALGPATQFRAVGSSLRLGAQGKEVAAFRDGIWSRRKVGGRFSLLWTEMSTAVHVANPGTGEDSFLGTFEMIGLVCDMLYAGRENSRSIARLDPQSGTWRCSDGTLWSELILRPAPPCLISAEQMLAVS